MNTDVSTLSLHDALPICELHAESYQRALQAGCLVGIAGEAIRHQECFSIHWARGRDADPQMTRPAEDRKSKRLNSSHITNSYAAFFVKKITALPKCVRPV